MSITQWKAPISFSLILFTASLPLHPFFVFLDPLFEGFLVLRRALYLLGFSFSLSL